MTWERIERRPANPEHRALHPVVLEGYADGEISLFGKHPGAVAIALQGYTWSRIRYEVPHIFDGLRDWLTAQIAARGPGPDAVCIPRDSLTAPRERWGTPFDDTIEQITAWMATNRLEARWVHGLLHVDLMRGLPPVTQEPPADLSQFVGRASIPEEFFGSEFKPDVLRAYVPAFDKRAEFKAYARAEFEANLERYCEAQEQIALQEYSGKKPLRKSDVARDVGWLIRHRVKGEGFKAIQDADGYPEDTVTKAVHRLEELLELGSVSRPGRRKDSKDVNPRVRSKIKKPDK